jgi:hypothetical protein
MRPWSGKERIALVGTVVFDFEFGREIKQFEPYS